MSINYQQYYREQTPYYLVTIIMPELEIRLISPEIEPQTITSSDGATYVYSPGLSNIPSPVHQLSVSGANQNLEFYIPRHYGSVYPLNLSWDQATIEIAHWFLGTEFEDRRVLYSGEVGDVSFGGLDEPLAVTADTVTVDSKLIFDEATRITDLSWADVANVPESSGGSYSASARRRAYFSENRYYGEIIGFPLYARCWVVKNDVEAEHSTATAYSPFKAVVCDGTLVSNSLRTNCPVWSHNRTNYRETPNLTPYESTDDLGRTVTLVNLQHEIDLPTYTLWWHPSTVTAGPERVVALWPWGKDNTIGLGDMIKQTADDDTFYRYIEKFEDGHPQDSTLYGVITLDQEYGGLAVQEYELATYIPLIAEDNKVFLKSNIAGGKGRIGDPNSILRDAPDVIYEYLLRCGGIKIDLERIRGLRHTWLSNFKIDGQLTEQMSALEWLRRDIYPLLPVAEAWGGNGYYLYVLDQGDPLPVVNLSLGREGTDGDRLSKLSYVSKDDIINDVTINAQWNAEREVYNSQYLMTESTINPLVANITAYAFNSRRQESILKYGKRSVTVNTKWVNDALTAQLIQQQIVNRFWRPTYAISYALNRKYAYLQVGDIVQFTDTEMGITNHIGRITSIRYDLDRIPVVIEQI